MGATKLEIIFSCGQGETATPENGFRHLTKRLRQTWAVESSKNVFSNEALTQSRLIVFAGCQRKFTAKEFSDLRQYLKRGGHLVILLGEGGEEAAGTNVNFLLEEYGMTITNDTVIRSAFKEYFVPKEALVTNGYLQRMSTSSGAKQTNQGAFLFPYGATMKVKTPAIPLLVTGASCYPTQKPVCGFYYDQNGAGRIMTISSVQIFHDNFIEKEENMTLADRLFGLILSEKLPRVLPDQTDIPDAEPIFDVTELANRVTPVLEKFTDLSDDPSQIYNTMHDVASLTKVADVLQTYKEIGLDNEPLALIAPKFEGVYPNLQPAVYPPGFEDLSRPELEMFDFNKELVSGREKLNQVVAEYSQPDSSVASYINEIAAALSLGPQSTPPVRNPKELLENVATQLINFKSSGWAQ